MGWEAESRKFTIYLGIFVFVFKIWNIFLVSEPGSAPRRVHVRPLSSSTMVVQWDEPEHPKGQITVRYAAIFIFRFFLLF